MCQFHSLQTEIFFPEKIYLNARNNHGDFRDSLVSLLHKLEWLSRDNLSSPPFAYVTYRNVKN